MDPYEWRSASVSHPDWSGTAQLDQRMTTAGIEERVGLDPNKWTVVGIDIGGRERGQHLRVVAVDHNVFPAGSDVFPRIAASNGGVIPATEFLVHDLDPYDLLKAVTHFFELRLRHRGTRDFPIRVIAQDDSPAGWTDSGDRT